MADPRFQNSPLLLPMIQFSPRVRVGMQVAISFVMMFALYCAYKGVQAILDATDWSGYTMPEEEEIPGWFLLLMPLLAVIPGMYIFMFLKYNFNH